MRSSQDQDGYSSLGSHHKPEDQTGLGRPTCQSVDDYSGNLAGELVFEWQAPRLCACLYLIVQDTCAWHCVLGWHLVRQHEVVWSP
jgi:hypothetical protein